MQAGSGTKFSLEFFDQICIAFRVFLRFPCRKRAHSGTACMVLKISPPCAS